MNFYKKNGEILISTKEYNCIETIKKEEVINSNNSIFLLKEAPVEKSRRCYAVSDSELFFTKEESLELIKKPETEELGFEDWILDLIKKRKLSSINTNFPNWETILHLKQPKKWKVNIAGLGDVGGMLLTGLRIAGGDVISQIGIFDLDGNKEMRWLYEAGQIFSYGNDTYYPEVFKVLKNDLFDCDMFIFTVSAGVPPLGTDANDVRMAQYEANSKIINLYGKMAREAGFKGIFAVVSDPVDLLCKSVYEASNKDENNNFDYLGLAPEQIRGYGLGVMYARAAFYAKMIPEAAHFVSEGRAYGPHGEGLIVADSIKNYNEELSVLLTQKAINANIDVRRTGFKPFVAPALSSGCLSIISTIKGNWHYSSTFIGGVFMGTLNKMTQAGIEIERPDMPQKLYSRISKTYERLAKI